MKYSDQIGFWLKSLGYSHYFYVGGGNIMHLTESFSRYLIGIPVVHEVAAGIAAEYFNVVSEDGKKALALVTTGPGLTNMITAIAGAWLESRELLVIGGQVKASDLSNGKVRSRGIQEIDGIQLVTSITKEAFQFKNPISSDDFYNLVSKSWQPRMGPVFLEFPLDVQAANFNQEILIIKDKTLKLATDIQIAEIVEKYNYSKKPVVLIGGGVSYKIAEQLQSIIDVKQIPVMTTYNGADRINGFSSNYLGRPNTWGQRSSNILIQKADLIIAIGTRLGLQQTGFNWQEFGRDAIIVQIDIDESELKKGHPNINIGLDVDANDFLKRFISSNIVTHIDWLEYASKVRESIPRIESVNKTGNDYISPYDFILELESLTSVRDLIIPCSSGSAFTLTMQLFQQRFGQRIVTNKSLASMGYGLSGAIGACIACDNKRRTILIEGDGGFAQNIQELGTAEINGLNLKIFIFNDQGHASIRMTQINYFDGKYLGCDRKSGLGLPNWDVVFKGWGIPVIQINKNFHFDSNFLRYFNEPGICAFVVQIDPEQTYFPKISSRITETGSMISNPIDKMTPEIDYI